ncbi:uncharacterized protein [Macaca fascicularis]|uniref:uncharacterized protein n=1 Tax=Macaca fascicularis TaxID=9541 RepID=UPI003D15F189
MRKKLDLQLLQLPPDLLCTSPNPGPTSVALTSKVSSSPAAQLTLPKLLSPDITNGIAASAALSTAAIKDSWQYLFPCSQYKIRSGVRLAEPYPGPEKGQGRGAKAAGWGSRYLKKSEAGRRRQGSSQTPGPRDSASSWVTRTQRTPGSRLPAVPARPPTRNRTLQTSDSVVSTSGLPPQDAVPRLPPHPLPSVPRSGSAVPTPGSLSSNKQQLQQRPRPSPPPLGRNHRDVGCRPEWLQTAASAERTPGYWPAPSRKEFSRSRAANVAADIPTTHPSGGQKAGD